MARAAAQGAPVKVRLYEPADLPGVIETYTASIRSLAASYYSPEQIAAWAPVPADPVRWQERLAPLHIIVAEIDGALAGFASYTDGGYLDHLFTHPAYARRGVATGLYQCVEEALRVGGAPKITTLASLAGRPFFDRQGFRVDREESAECRGVYLRRFAMHKSFCSESDPL
jgi:GNAT superfamily N-acetyltransferase